MTMDWDEKTYFAAAFGTQEWLKRRLAKGNMPWPMVVRWEWIAKLLLPKRAYSLPKSWGGGEGLMGHTGGAAEESSGCGSKDNNILAGEESSIE